MNCSTFEDHLSDYLEAALDSRTKAECAAHRLVCRECRALYNDVRATMTDMSGLAVGDDITLSPVLTMRILAATTPGKMLSCGEFDLLIERYFDGVLLPTEFQTFQNHFDQCRQCRRLLGGIEDAIALCHEAKAEVPPPDDLPERIVAATTGRTNGRLYGVLLGVWAALNTPQWAVALLILAAATTLLGARFPTMGDFTAEARESAERLRDGLQVNGREARTHFQQAANRVESLLVLPESRDVSAPARSSAPKLQTVDWQTAPFPTTHWNVPAGSLPITGSETFSVPGLKALPTPSPRSH